MPIEASRPQERWIDFFGMVGRGNDSNPRAFVDPSKLLKDQIDDLRPILDIVAPQCAPIGNSIDFVDEQDRWR